MGEAAQRWAELQAGRGIPAEIVAAAPADPWTHEPRDFAVPVAPDDAGGRAGRPGAGGQRSGEGEDTRVVDTPSRQSATELLGDGGTVLDVGCGGGAAAFALDRLTAVVGVDRQADMLAQFAAAARARGVLYRTVPGSWPEVAEDAGHADVVVCHHVLHNVVDLPPFLRALTAAAGRGVVVEMFGEHPLAWLDPLWLHFHDLRRPPPATVDDAAAVLAEIGLDPVVTRWERSTPPRQDVAFVTRRLCLPAGRTDEVAAALSELPPRPRRVATLVWRP